MDNWTVKIVDKGFKFERDIYVYRKVFEGIEVLHGDTVTRYSNGQEIPDKPTLSFNPETLQALADELAHIGIKPQKGFLEGKLEATESHLKDMRTLLKLK